MATCPPNSTDCLLQAILDAQSGFNWNPPTFGATIAIGVLALIIATMTVFQGALTAGPGRLKASSRAIGPAYYLKTRTEFSWIELRFRTTAWVPYIDIIGWFDRPGSEQRSRIRHFRKHPSYGAGWLNLINSVPLECQHWSVTRCQTDYLPSDVQAAPARASIRAVVELAVLSGCDTVTIAKDLPLARGRGSQLSFRDHPYLGISAVYDQFLIDDQEPRVDVHKCHLLYLTGQFIFQGIPGAASQFDGKSANYVSLNSLGVIDALNLRKGPTGELTPYERHSVEVGLLQGSLKAIGLGLLTWDSPENCTGLPFAKLKIRNAILALCQTCQPWANFQREVILKSLDKLLQFRSNLMAYDKNADFIKLFGAERLQAQLGWTWLDGLVNDDEQGRSGPRDLRLHQGELCWWQWRVDGTVDFPMAVMPRDGHLVILPAALQICVDWLERVELFDEYTFAQKLDARFALGHQLREVDYWLLHHGSAESAEQVFGILMDFTDPASHVEQASLNAETRAHEASAKLRRPPSFERIRPPQVYERGRTGLYEQRRPGWRAPSPPRSPRDSFVSLTDPKEVRGRDMSEQRARDISVLDERPFRDSGLSSNGQTTRTHRSGHKNHEQQPFDDFNRNRRSKVPTQATRGTMVVYGEGNSDHQPTRSSSGRSRESTLEATSDVDRDAVQIRRSREVKGQGTDGLPGNSPGSDSVPTTSPSKRALVVYQGNSARDETLEQLPKTHHREVSNASSTSQKGALVIRKGKETRDENTKELPGNNETGSVDPIDRRAGELVIWKGNNPKHTSAKRLPKQGERKVTERDTKQEDYGDVSSDKWGNDLPGRRIPQGLSHEASSPIVEDDPPGSHFLKNLSSEGDLEDSSDESLSPERDRRASVDRIGEYGEITIERTERRISDRSRTNRFDADMGPWSDNGTSSDNSKYSFSKDKPRSPIWTYENGSSRRGSRFAEEIFSASEFPDETTFGRRKRRKSQKKDAAPKGSTRQRAQTGRQQATISSSNSHRKTNRKSVRLEGSNAHRAPGTDSILAGSSQLIRGKASPADMGMRTLLVYRAVLFATLCALAADTSCVYETEIGRRIVQVL